METLPDLMIDAQQLTRAVATAAGPRPLLNAVSFGVSPGEIVHLIGPSGSGKTTLLRLLNRLDEPTSGEVWIASQPLRQWDVRHLRRTVAMVFQESSLLGLTVRENLELPFKFNPARSTSAAAGEEQLLRALAMVELPSEFLSRREDELSVGQKQRVALARALIRPPQVLLLDEPTSGLDAPLAARLIETLKRTQRETGMTVISATHRLEEVRQMGGRVILLMAGRLVSDCSVEELFSGACNPWASQFLEAAKPGHGAWHGGEAHA